MDEPAEIEESREETMLLGVPLPEAMGLVGWGTLVIAIYTALTVGTGGYNEESVGTVTRWTGRISMLVFLLAYLRPWFATRPAESSAGWAVRNYRYLMLLLGASHTIHLGLIITLVVEFALDVDIVDIAAGGLGYLLMYVLVVLAATGRLADEGGREAWVESISTHYVWGVFVFTQTSTIAAKPETALFALAGFAAAYYRYQALRR
jgi:hypothetical protein